MNNKKSFKAGKYIISDPCYLTDDKWSKWLDDTDFFSPAGKFILEGFEIFAGSTSYGDGTYFVKADNRVIGECGVDAGLLSIVPFKLAQKVGVVKKVEQYAKRSLLVILDIEEDFDVRYDGGNFYFSKYDIITDGSDEEEKEEGDEDY